MLTRNNLYESLLEFMAVCNLYVDGVVCIGESLSHGEIDSRL